MSKKKVIIFGRGQYYNAKKKEIEEQYEVVGFIDNNPEYVFGDVQCGNVLPVYKPDKVSEFADDANILVMASRRSFIEMTTQLLSMGINETRIILGINLEPCFDMTEKLFKQHKSKIEIVDGNFKITGEVGDYYFSNSNDFTAIMREIAESLDPAMSYLKKIPLEPISRAFGREIGNPIDRFYIERFLANHCEDIHGHVMEVAENTYTLLYGKNVLQSDVLHVNGWNNAIKGNLATGAGIYDEHYDCLICTQTIQMIYEIENAMKNVFKLLKEDGVALITIHGISQLSLGDYNNWGEYWRITAKTARRLAIDAGFKERNIEIESFGNVKVAICFLYGMCREQLDVNDLLYSDEQYPLVIGIRVKK